MLDFNLVCENIYKKYSKSGIYFTEGLMSSILDLAKQSDVLYIYFKANNDLILQDDTFGSISIVFKKDTLEVTKNNINIFFNELSINYRNKDFKSLRLCFSFYKKNSVNSSLISDCETNLMSIRQIRNDLRDIFRKSEVFYNDNFIDKYFRDM